MVADRDVDDDWSLLREFEPVVRFTAGELFFPTAVETYVRHSTLWELEGRGEARSLIGAGDLTIDRLVVEASARPGAELSLRFVDAPLSRQAYRAWRKRPDRPGFSSRGRFTQVGIVARLIDALFRLALLLRGRVPGGLAAAAEQAYRSQLDPGHHPYYGRVVRDGGYIVLQYWYFYAMNDWRSSFGGANDHEADWEQVTIYLIDDPASGRRPAWVAFSAHDEVGDDLRRRWDDPELAREGDHPVVFAGAGSHSGAFVAGEYVTAVEPPASLRRVFKALQAVARFITPWSRGEIARGLGIPFVDYARGDGDPVGPGHQRAWSPVLIDDDTPWVQQYRGLWGLDTRDRFGGERAPAGPRYERGGAVRQSWSDPLGWAGLQKVPPTTAESEGLLRGRIDDIGVALRELDDDLTQRRVGLRRLVAETASIGDRVGLAPLSVDLQLRIAAAERDLQERVATRTTLSDERTAHLETLRRPPALAATQAHVRHKAVPTGHTESERLRFLRLWSAVSAPLLFLAGAFLLVDHQLGVVVGVATFAVVFLTIEAIARRRLVAFALTLIAVIVAALVALAVIQGLLGQWQFVLAALLAATAGAILLSNLRDLRRG
jgi:hypothetical protein